MNKKKPSFEKKLKDLITSSLKINNKKPIYNIDIFDVLARNIK